MNLETIKQLEICDNDNILEIGMGNGFFVGDIVAAAQNVKYTGCDFSETMIREAIELNHSFAPKVKFVLCDVTQLPFNDGSFDKVFTVNTIYFWEDARQILAEIRRVLKPNGIFIVTLRPKKVMDQLPVVQHGFTTYATDDIIMLLAQNDFQTLSYKESEDVEIKMDDRTVKNAFLIIKAIKTK